MKKVSDYTALLRSLGAEWKWLLRYVRQYRWEILLYVLIGTLGIVMGFGSSIASKYLIDAVISHNNQTLTISAFIVIVLGLSQILVSAGTSRISSLVGTRISNEVRNNIYEHIVSSRWESISKYHSGDLVNRLEGDSNTVANSIISFIPSVVTRSTQFLGCLAIVLYYDRIMAILALMSAPFLFFSSKTSAKMLRKYSKESREMNGTILSFSEESMQNLQTIKAFDLTGSYSERFKDLLSSYRTLRLNYDKFTILMSLCFSTLGLLVSYSCYGWGVWRLWQGAISYGTMTLFIQLSSKLTNSFSSLVSLAPSVISIATAAGRIMEISDLPTEKDENREEAELMLAEASKTGIRIDVQDVSYSYKDSDRIVLNHLCFYAEPGETIAFVGPSGEGKTTILRLLLGLMSPDTGTLSLSADETKKICISDSTRRFYSYVPQENAVFSGSIAENLRMVNPKADDTVLMEALKAADAWSFVKDLPEGIHTQIGERGINFSEGQIQRICIARAILRKAPVLIMDEATSALDADTEARVLLNLMQSDKKRTCILTTHRPSMLKYCNRVYRLSENGTLTLEDNKK